MTLRLRLVVLIGLAFTLTWSMASFWMLRDLRTRLQDTMDERLAASARMVVALMAELPKAKPASPSESKTALGVTAREGIACEIRLLRGGVVARTMNAPKDLAAGQSGYATRTVDGGRWRVFVLEQDGMRVTTADRMDARRALLHEAVVAAVLPFVIAILGSLVALWFGVRKGLEPLEVIRRALGQRTPETLDALPEGATPEELRPLVHTINVLLNQTRATLDREKRFTGDAAHQLRTPLTAVKTHIQVARLSEDGDRSIALARAEEAVQRLQRMIEQLLTLARVEEPFPPEGEERATVADILKQAIDELPPDAATRIRLADAPSEITLKIPAALGAAALRNVLDNALRYSPSDKPVGVSQVAGTETVSLLVLDEGHGLSEQECKMAVERFWRKGSGQGSGLGLSIVEAIVRRYGGTLKFRARVEGGLVVEITLPRAF